MVALSVGLVSGKVPALYPYLYNQTTGTQQGPIELFKKKYKERLCTIVNDGCGKNRKGGGGREKNIALPSVLS